MVFDYASALTAIASKKGLHMTIEQNLEKKQRHVMSGSNLLVILYKLIYNSYARGYGELTWVATRPMD